MGNGVCVAGEKAAKDILGQFMVRSAEIQQEALAVRNQLSCEAHRELLIEGMKMYIRDWRE